MNNVNHVPKQVPGLQVLNAKQKQHIVENGIGKVMHEDLIKSEKKARMWGIFLAVGGAAMFLAFMTEETVSVIMLLMCAGCFLLGLFLIVSTFGKGRKVTEERLQKSLVNLEKNYGNKETIFKEIESQMRPDWAVHVTEDGSYITRDWYITKGYFNFVKIQDISAVVGVMGKGTFVVTVHGDEFDDTYGGNPAWGLIVNLLMETNPYILIRGDSVLMPDGREVDVLDAYNARAFEAIATSFLTRKQIF